MLPSLADFGRKEISLAEVDMLGLITWRTYDELGNMPLSGAKISGSLYMTIQTAALIETLKIITCALVKEKCQRHFFNASERTVVLRWCLYNIFLTHDHAVAVVAHDGSAAQNQNSTIYMVVNHLFQLITLIRTILQNIKEWLIIVIKHSIV